VDLDRKRISHSLKDSRPQASVVSKGEERKERKKEERGQAKRQKQKSTFTNNPFAAAFEKRNRGES